LASLVLLTAELIGLWASKKRRKLSAHPETGMARPWASAMSRRQTEPLSRKPKLPKSAAPGQASAGLAGSSQGSTSLGEERHRMELSGADWTRLK
jgi:hypothetical protein